MTITAHQVFDDIKSYMTKQGLQYRDWYVGITENARECMFVEHGVSEKQGSWIFRECPNNRSAKNVKETLIKMGCEGSAGGWDESINIVYAYLKTAGTTP